MQRWAAKSNPNLHHDSHAISIPESPRQASSGASVQAVRCHYASALKCDALRRFYGDGILGAGLKAPILPPIHTKSV